MNLQACIFTKNPCYQAGRRITPAGIMVHSTGANNPALRRYVQPDDGLLGANKSQNDWNRPGVELGVHAFIGQLADGSVATYQTLPWNHRAWHCGSGKNGSANNTHISFEICEGSLTDKEYFAAVYQEAAELCAYLCREFQLDPLADGVLLCHSEGCRRGIASNHADVEHWWPKHGRSMDDFRREVKKLLETKEEEEEMTREEIKVIVRETLAELEAERAAALPPDWGKAELAAAIADGITDGTRPMAAPTRMEAAIMVRRGKAGAP